MPRKSRKKGRNTVQITPKIVEKPTWGYARISIDGERSEDSIESQTAMIKDYVHDKADLDFRGVYTDLGYTGRDFDRPGYVELAEGIKCGDVQCVVVKDLSRLGRTHIEIAELIFDIFPSYDVRFISINDHYDSFSDDAARKKLLILFKSLINQMYSRDLGMKIRSAHAAKQRRAELAGNVPYGYKRDIDKITLAIDGDAADVVKRVFDMRMSGVSANKIAKQLTQEGVPSPQNRRYQLGQITHEMFANRIVWNIGMVSKMLQSETYTGTLVQGKYNCNGKKHTMLPKEKWIRHEGTHPAIISREQFDAVQKLVQETKAKYARNGSWTSEENKYAGKIFCARCGKTVTRINSRNSYGTVSYYYSCRHCDYDVKAEKGLTRTPKLSQAVLDAAVMECLRVHIAMMIDFEKFTEGLALSETHNRRREDLKRDMAKWSKVVSSADRTLSSAYTHHLDGLLDAREFGLVRAKSEQDKKDALDKRSRAEAEFKKHDSMAARHKYWRKIYADFTTAESSSKELAQLLVDKIEVTPLTNELHIRMNYKDGLDEYRDLITKSEVNGNA